MKTIFAILLLCPLVYGQTKELKILWTHTYKDSVGDAIPFENLGFELKVVSALGEMWLTDSPWMADIPADTIRFTSPPQKLLPEVDYRVHARAVKFSNGKRSPWKFSNVYRIEGVGPMPVSFIMM